MALTYMLDIILTQWKTLTKQQLTPMLNSVKISVILQSDVSFCVFYHLKLLSTAGVSLPTADWQPDVHFGSTGAGCESQGTLRAEVSHTPSLQKCSWGTLASLRQGWSAACLGQCWAPQALQDCRTGSGLQLLTQQGSCGALGSETRGAPEWAVLGTVPWAMFSPCWGVS